MDLLPFLDYTHVVSKNCFASSSLFELFVLSIMQEDVRTLCMRSDSVFESSVRLGHHNEKTAWPHHLSAT